MFDISSVTYPSHSGSNGVTFTMMPHLAYVDFPTQRLLNRVSEVTVNHEQLDPIYADLARQVEHLDRDQLLRKFLSLKFNGMLEYYTRTPELNPPVGKTRQDKGGKKQLAREISSKGFAHFHLNVGRRNGVLPEHLIQTVNAVPGGGRIKVGRIEIMRNSAMLEGDSRFVPQILNAFEQVEVNGKPVTIRVMRNNSGSLSRGKRDRGYRGKGKIPSGRQRL